MSGNTSLAQQGDQRLRTVFSDPRLIIQMGAEGFAHRAVEWVTLMEGIDVYNIPGRTAHVFHIWGTGCTKIVRAMGGRLEPLPFSVDAVTGKRQLGVRVDKDPISGVARSISADAICVVRNPKNGSFVVAMATAHEDIQLMLLKELEKLDREGRDDVVRFLTEHDLEAIKAESGWLVYPYSEGVWLAANIKMGGVREALRKHREFANIKVLTPRIQSKATRLAFMANSVTRCRFHADQFVKVDGLRAKVVRLPVLAWIQYDDKEEIKAMVEALAAEGGHHAVTELVHAQQGDDEIKDELLLEADDDFNADEDAQDELDRRARRAPATPSVHEQAPAKRQAKARPTPEPEDQPRDPEDPRAEPDSEELNFDHVEDEKLRKALYEIVQAEDVLTDQGINDARAASGLKLDVALESLTIEQAKKYLRTIHVEVDRQLA